MTEIHIYIIKVLLIALIVGSATFLGVFIGIKFNKKRGISFGTGFAAGIMILISIFDLIPESLKEANIGLVLIWLVVGAIVIFLFDESISHIHSIREIEDCDRKCLVKMTYLLTVGLVLHDFPEGFVVASSSGYFDSTGLVVAAAAFIHNIPEGYALTVASSKYQNKNFFYRSALFSMIATFSGAILGMILLNYFEILDYFFLSAAAGAMLYISFHELIPIARKYKKGADIYLGLASSLAIYGVLKIFC